MREKQKRERSKRERERDSRRAQNREEPSSELTPDLQIWMYHDTKLTTGQKQQKPEKRRFFKKTNRETNVRGLQRKKDPCCL